MCLLSRASEVSLNSAAFSFPENRVVQSRIIASALFSVGFFPVWKDTHSIKSDTFLMPWKRAVAFNGRD